MTGLKIFIGYLLVTSGFFTLYLLYFRRDHLPPIFKKWWFAAFITVIAVLLAAFGWLLATKVI